MNPIASNIPTFIAHPLDGLDKGRSVGDAAKSVPDEIPFVRGEGDGHTVDPNDIKQGGYGSCGLLSTLHSLAQQDPEAIQNMIQDNGDGTYTVTFQEQVTILGMELPIWRPVQVTVSGPFSGAQHGDSSAQGQEIWPAIIEKAYVQHFHPEFSSNGTIWPGDKGVLPADVMEHVLGAGAQTSGTGDVSAEQMTERLGNNEVVVAWTPNFTDSNGNSTVTTEQQALIDHYGIIGGHAYAVSEVIPAGTPYIDPHTGVEITAQEDVVVLDNPHGASDVVMPYSDYQSVYGWVSSAPTS